MLESIAILLSIFITVPLLIAVIARTWRCPKCGEYKYHRVGIESASGNDIQRFRCFHCGFEDEKPVKRVVRRFEVPEPGVNAAEGEKQD